MRGWRAPEFYRPFALHNAGHRFAIQMPPGCQDVIAKMRPGNNSGNRVFAVQRALDLLQHMFIGQKDDGLQRRADIVRVRL